MINKEKQDSVLKSVKNCILLNMVFFIMVNSYKVKLLGEILSTNIILWKVTSNKHKFKVAMVNIKLVITTVNRQKIKAYFIFSILKKIMNL